MVLDVDVVQRLLDLRRVVRLADGRPNDGRCGNVSAAIEVEFGWKRECGYLRLLDGSVSWVHCWNRLDSGAIVDVTADQFGDLWSGDIVALEAGDGLIDRYLPDPREWKLTPQGSVTRPDALECRCGDEARLIRVDDRACPWMSLARESLRLVTGWQLGDSLVDLAARSLRAQLISVGFASTTLLIRPLVTASIQHLAVQGTKPWIAVEFNEPL